MNLLPDFLIIPSQIINDETLQPLDGYVYGIIYWYSKMKMQKCVAKSKQIGELLKAKPNSIDNAIMRLTKRGYIHSTYDRQKHERELFPLVSFSGGIPSDMTEHPLKRGDGIPSFDDSDRAYLRTPNNNSNKNIDTKVSIGEASPEKGFGNTEIDGILVAFKALTGQIPADKKPRQVAQNIKQLIGTFIKHNGELFLLLRGEELTASYVLEKFLLNLKTKKYAEDIEKLDTVKARLKVYLDKIADQLQAEKQRKEADASFESI